MASEILCTIMEVLKQSKDSGNLAQIHSLNREILDQFGIMSAEEIFIFINRRQRINLAKHAVQLGANLAEIVELLTWKDFEGFVAEVLIENNYECVESFRRRGNLSIQGMEIDVIGVRGRTVIAIDAKMWSIRSGKTSALKRAAERQKERTHELSDELDALSKKITRLTSGNYRLVPVLVTWLVEDVELHEGVPVVPIFKLNSFILDFDQYEDLIVSYLGSCNI